jgi:hypothetical protein
VTLVDERGRPLVAAPEECPKCGELVRKADRLTVTGLGGHWRVLHRCGHEFNRGQGDRPAEE